MGGAHGLGGSRGAIQGQQWHQVIVLGGPVHQQDRHVAGAYQAFQGGPDEDVAQRVLAVAADHQQVDVGPAGAVADVLGRVAYFHPDFRCAAGKFGEKGQL
ncbi:hypothetical protein D9M71_248950 [compost metagenome]